MTRSRRRAINRHHRNPRYLYDIALPPELTASTFGDVELADSDLVAIAVPSRAYGEVVDGLGRRLGADTAVLSMTKGLDPVSHRRLSELLTPEVGAARVAVLSGPNHAEEVAREFPTASVVASESIELARSGSSDAISSPALRGMRPARRGRRRAVRRRQERDGAGGRDLGRARLRRQREGGDHHPRDGGDVPAGGRRSAQRRGRMPGWRGWATWWPRAPPSTRATGGPGSCWRRASRPGWIESEIGQVAEGLTTAPVLEAVAAGRGLELPITSAVCRVAFAGRDPLDALAELDASESPPRSEGASAVPRRGSILHSMSDRFPAASTCSRPSR